LERRLPLRHLAWQLRRQRLELLQRLPRHLEELQLHLRLVVMRLPPLEVV
jgi:hypothetical protein